MKKNDRNRTPLSFKIIIILIIAATGIVIITLSVLRRVQDSMQFYSRYTYVRELPFASTDSMDIKEEAESWIRGFLEQYSGSLVPSQVRLKNVTLDSIEISDENEETVRIRFSAGLADEATDYFANWNPRFVNGKMTCDWTVKFGIETTKSKRDGIYVISMTDNIKENENPADKQKETTASAQSEFTTYRIEEGQLEVSFDGESSFVEVPVDLKNMPLGGNTNELAVGSFYLTKDTAVFLSGGMTTNGEKIPVSAVYTRDRGLNWLTAEVDRIFDVSYYYVKMFSEKEGVITIGYASTDTEEFSKIFYTSDGGESWELSKGTAPSKNHLKGVNFLSKENAYFCYSYAQGQNGNLYISRDGANNFSVVSFASQQLDSDAGSLKWEDVYKEATVPEYDDKGRLTVFLTQGEGGTYHEGKTAAKYISEDDGLTWKYAGQEEYITD